MLRVLAVAMVLMVSACSGADEASVTTVAESATPTDAGASTTAGVTTTSTSSTTIAAALWDFDYEVWVYDAFESTDGYEIGSPCFSISNSTFVSEGAQLVLREDVTDRAIATARLGPGAVRLDQTGRSEGEEGWELFLYCAFSTRFHDVELAEDGLYRVEFPGAGGEAQVFHTTEDLLAGKATAFQNDELRVERQRLRTTAVTTQAPTTTVVDVEAVRAEFLDALVRGLEHSTGTSGEFDRVDMILFNDGMLEIEGHLRWASKDAQPNSQWESITFLALFLGLLDAKPVNLFGGEPRVHMVTVSSDGKYRYESLTDWDTLVAVDDRSVGFDGWVEAAGADFS